MTNTGCLWVEFEYRSPGPPMGVSIGPLPDKKISFESRIAHLFLFFWTDIILYVTNVCFQKATNAAFS